MGECLWLVGGDARCFWAAQQFRQSGYEVLTFGVPELPDAPLPERFPILVLPFPSFSGERVRGAAAISAETVLSRCGGGTRVFGGQLGIYRTALEQRSARVSDLYDTEPLTTANAVPTAEGALALAIGHSPITLHGAACLVIGYGRIGKILAQRLRALGAMVTVAARKSADRALAEGFGLQSDVTGAYLHGLSQYDFVFNTVPSLTLDETQLRQLPPHCLLVELASPPYGIDRAACERLGLTHVPAAGLPGKFAPKTAGALYAQSILALLQREETP